jgi:hypothetical protein
MKPKTIHDEEFETLTFVRPFKNSPIPEWLGAVFIGLFFYMIFLLLAVISGDFETIISSPMHFIQLDFSFAIVLGLLTVLIVNSKFKEAFLKSERYFDATHQEYVKYVKSVVRRINSLGGFVFSLPLMIISVVDLIFVVGPNIPDDMFPVALISFPYLYLAIIEFSFFCVFLMGNVGLWFTWCMVKALQDLRESFSLELPALPTKRLMGEFSDLILTYTVLLTLILGSVFPSLLAIWIRYSDKQIHVILGSVGLGLDLLITAVVFIAPQLQLHYILIDAKCNIVEFLSAEYAENEDKIINKMRLMKSEGVTQERMRDIEALISASRYLVDRMLFVQSNVREWSFDITAVLTVVTSSLIPVLSFLFQVIGSFFSP